MIKIIYSDHIRNNNKNTDSNDNILENKMRGEDCFRYSGRRNIQLHFIAIMKLAEPLSHTNAVTKVTGRGTGFKSHFDVATVSCGQGNTQQI